MKISREELNSMVDPVSLSMLWMDTPLYPWQKTTLQKTLSGDRFVALVTPNEAGKTSLVVALTGLTFMSMYPGGQVVSTAGAFRQVSQQLWPVVRSLVSKFPGWRMTEDTLFAPPIRGLPPASWTIFSTDDPNKAEGYHNRHHPDENGTSVWCPLLYMVDEAKSVDDGIFQAVYRCNPAFCLVASTPGEEAGEFYNIVSECKLLAQRPDEESEKSRIYDLVEVTWNDCPHLLTGKARRLKENLIKRFGITHPYIQSSVYGRFYRAGGFFIFDMPMVDLAMSGNVPHVGKDRRAAIDLAGGGDESVFGVRIGNHVEDLEGINEPDYNKQATWFLKKFEQWQLKPEWVRYDRGGLGEPVVAIMKERGWSGMIPYKFDAEARDKHCYASRAMEDHWTMHQQICAGQIGIPADTKLRDQMRLRKYKMPNRNERLMVLESKDAVRKRKEPSPDRLDVLIMMFGDMPEYDGIPNASTKPDVAIHFMGKDYTWEEIRAQVNGDMGRGRSHGGMLLDE